MGWAWVMVQNLTEEHVGLESKEPGFMPVSVK